jgi:hypothetical protein
VITYLTIFIPCLQHKTEEFSTWKTRLQMSGYKRKGRASPELLESEEEDRLSPEPHSRMVNDRESSQNKRRSISDCEPYLNEERNQTRVSHGGPRPEYGGFCRHRGERRLPAEYEGRSSPGYYHHAPSSSRGLYKHSRSPEPYGRRREGANWWSDGKEGWPKRRGGRVQEYGPGSYADEVYDHEYDLQGSRSGRRVVKAETSMEAPSKRPVQLDR